MIPQHGGHRLLAARKAAERRPVRTAESADPIDPPLASVWSDRNRADRVAALIRRCILWACVALLIALWAYAAVIAAGAGLMERTPL